MTTLVNDKAHRSGFEQLAYLDAEASQAADEYLQNGTETSGNSFRTLGSHVGQPSGRVYPVISGDLGPSPQMTQAGHGPAPLLPKKLKTPHQLTHFVDLEANHPPDQECLPSTPPYWVNLFSRIGKKITTALPKRRHGRRPFPKDRPVEIYYSVFKNIPEFENYLIADRSEEDGNAAGHFGEVIESVIEAISLEMYPSLIAQGSSGSYFAYNEEGDIVGVFKPKDEEPYGPLSPKWTKWVHRNLFPCFFGRSCLIPNTGYICEAAASLLDRRLQTDIVPHTEIVYLSSPTFYYRYFERRRGKNDPRLLARKPGSFQLFLRNYEEADKFFRKHPWPDKMNQRYGSVSDSGIWTLAVQKQFRLELEKLVILDYIMRNTDRGLDNWMIKLEWVDDTDSASTTSRETTPHSSTCLNNPTTTPSVKVPRLKIGAIDSGLSWPWKHPDEWRSYPFGWLFLPLDLIGQPFSRETKEHFLPLLTSSKWWEQSYVEFRNLFSVDPDFKERMWKKQWAVMKGQAFNVVETLKSADQGPLELARRDRVLIWDGQMDIPVRIPIETLSSAIGTPLHPTVSASTVNTSNTARSRRSSMDENLLLPALNSLSVSPMKTDTVPLLSPVADESNGPSMSGAALALSGLMSTSPTSASVSASTPTHKRLARGSSLSLEARYRELEASSPTKRASGPACPKSHGRRQSIWDELISENSTTRPIKVTEGSSSPPINDVGFSHAESSNQATRKVIIERLQIATHKSPFFTWC